MPRFRMISIPVSLLITAGVAGAQQHWSGSRGGGQSGHGAQPAHPAGGGTAPAMVSSNGVAPRWGGSPPERRHDRDHEQLGFGGQPRVYVPIVVDAPYPVPVAADTACAPQAVASVAMPVITTRHEDRQLTTIEVYRLQPRFQKP